MRSQPRAVITLREATATDVAGVVRLIAAHAAQAGERTPITEEYVRRYLTSPGSRILLAEQGGGLAGLLSYSRRPDLYHAAEVGTVEELVVEAAYRGQGIGTALLAELESRALAEGWAEISLAVVSTDAEAIRFYRRRGYTDEALLLERHAEPAQANRSG